MLDYGDENAAVAAAAVSVCGNQVHYSVSFLFRLIKLFSTFVNNLRLRCHFIATVAGQGFGPRVSGFVLCIWMLIVHVYICLLMSFFVVSN